MNVSLGTYKSVDKIKDLYRDSILKLGLFKKHGDEIKSNALSKQECN